MSKARDIASAIPAPSTVSSAELGYLDGVTSAIQTQVDAKTAKATLTTTGDIYYASAANTPARLGIGSSAQVLTVAAGVPSWATPAAGGAGNMALITSGTMTSGSTLSITGLSSYTDILFMVDSVQFTSTNEYARLTINNNTTANYARYTSQISTGQGITDISITSSGSNFPLTAYTNIQYNSGSNYFAIKLTNCKNAGFTDVDYDVNWRDANHRFHEKSKGIYKVSEAVSSLQFFTTGSVTFTAGNYYVYGA